MQTTQKNSVLIAIVYSLPSASSANFFSTRLMKMIPLLTLRYAHTHLAGRRASAVGDELQADLGAGGALQAQLGAVAGGRLNRLQRGAQGREGVLPSHGILAATGGQEQQEGDDEDDGDAHGFRLQRRERRNEVTLLAVGRRETSFLPLAK